MTEIRLTLHQINWLRSRGGRTINDVLLRNGRPAILVRNRGQDITVYVPDFKEDEEVDLNREDLIKSKPADGDM